MDYVEPKPTEPQLIWNIDDAITALKQAANEIRDGKSGHDKLNDALYSLMMAWEETK